MTKPLCNCADSPETKLLVGPLCPRSHCATTDLTFQWWPSLGLQYRRGCQNNTYRRFVAVSNIAFAKKKYTKVLNIHSMLYLKFLN